MKSNRSATVRDAALRRLTRINRWAVAATVALTGVLTEVAASAFPGKAVHSPTAASGKAKQGARSSTGSAATSEEQLQPPAQAPQATQESAPSQQSESAPSQQSESTPSQQSQTAPEQSAQEAAQAQSSQEAAPSSEASAPVVSGGS